MLRQCLRFARSWVWWRGRDEPVRAARHRPGCTRDHLDPVGPDTDAFLRVVAGQVDRCVAAWGAHPPARRRAPAVAAVVTRHATRQYRRGLPGADQERSQQDAEGMDPLKLFVVLRATIVCAGRSRSQPDVAKVGLAWVTGCRQRRLGHRLLSSRLVLAGSQVYPRNL